VVWKTSAGEDRTLVRRDLPGAVLWLAVILMALSFFAFNQTALIADLSFAVPVTACKSSAETVRAGSLALTEKPANPMRWPARLCVDCGTSVAVLAVYGGTCRLVVLGIAGRLSTFSRS